MTGHHVTLSSPTRREYAKRLIGAAPDDAVCIVRAGTRSDDQNAKMWAMLSDVSRSKPEGRMHTPEIWKCLFMQACGHAVQFVNGLDGLPFPVGFRSSKMTKDQMSELIEFIYAYGAQHGVEWSE